MLIGTSAIFFATINGLKAPAYTARSQFTRGNMATLVGVFPVAVASTVVDAKLIRCLDPKCFYILIYVLLSLTGIKLTWDGTVGRVQVH